MSKLVLLCSPPGVENGETAIVNEFVSVIRDVRSQGHFGSEAFWTDFEVVAFHAANGYSRITENVGLKWKQKGFLFCLKSNSS